MTDAEVRRAIRSFILENFLPGEAPESLADSTPLVTSGVITSLSLLELVTFIENRFPVTLLPDDIGVERMDSIDLLVDLTLSRARKLPKSSGGRG